MSQVVYFRPGVDNIFEIWETCTQILTEEHLLDFLTH